MDFRKLIRDPEVHLSDWIEAGDAIITTRGCRIYFPSAWTECMLAQVGNETWAVGYFLLVYGNRATVFNACTAVRLTPSASNTIRVGEDDYIELTFDPGTEVIDTVNCVIDDTMSYKVYKRFVEMGKVPYYFDSIDVLSIFNNVIELCGTKLGAGESILSAIVASTMKNPEDPTEPYAFVCEGAMSHGQYNFMVIPFRDVQYGASNATAKLMGSYADVAINSELVNPSERNETIEELLRS